MISLFKKVISDHPDWLSNPKVKISFLKMSTPTSGAQSTHGKVIVFVFEEGSKDPTLCIKTARTYASSAIVKKNLNNLKLLESSVVNTNLSNIFPKPLFLYDDNSFIFSVETACGGKKCSLSKAGMSKVVDTYTSWQKILSQNSEKKLYKNDIQRLAYDTIGRLGISSDSAQKLRKYFDNLPLDNEVNIPEVAQHGDMTPDNVLLSKDKVCFIDFDYVGMSNVPGFDLFNLLNRIGVTNQKLREKLARYFEVIGIRVQNFDAILFLFFLQEHVRKNYADRGEDGLEIIKDFELLLRK